MIISKNWFQEAEGEQGRGRISELAETLNQMEANIAEVKIQQLPVSASSVPLRWI